MEEVFEQQILPIRVTVKKRPRKVLSINRPFPKEIRFSARKSKDNKSNRENIPKTQQKTPVKLKDSSPCDSTEFFLSPKINIFAKLFGKQTGVMPNEVITSVNLIRKCRTPSSNQRVQTKRPSVSRNSLSPVTLEFVKPGLLDQKSHFQSVHRNRIFHHSKF